VEHSRDRIRMSRWLAVSGRHPSGAQEDFLVRNTRRRATGTRSGTFVAVALMLGGGVLVTANVFASATEGEPAGASAQPSASAGWQAATVDCPDVGAALTSVPEEAKADVDRELAALDGQTAEAYQRLKDSSAAQQQDPAFTDNAILGP